MKILIPLVLLLVDADLSCSLLLLRIGEIILEKDTILSDSSRCLVLCRGSDDGGGGGHGRDRELGARGVGVGAGHRGGVVEAWWEFVLVLHEEF